MNVSKILVFGVGRKGNGSSKEQAYRIWAKMLERCYCKKSLQRKPQYMDCIVCDEWLHYENFKLWFVQFYRKGLHLDKDIIKQGNRVYSPDTCCFVPQEINNLLITSIVSKGKYPQGVSKEGNKFRAALRRDGKSFRIGLYQDIEAAALAYKYEKISYIKEVADRYLNNGSIDINICVALKNHNI